MARTSGVISVPLVAAAAVFAVMTTWKAGRRTLTQLLLANALLADACVVVSCLIQYGAGPGDLAASMGRLGNAEPASVIAAVIDMVAATSVTQQQPNAGASR